MRLYPPCDDEHTAPQHAEHLPHTLQRAPLSRWLEKAGQAGAVGCGWAAALLNLCVQMGNAADSIYTAVVVLMLQSVHTIIFYSQGRELYHVRSHLDCDSAALQPTEGQSRCWLFIYILKKSFFKPFSECIFSLNPFVIISFASQLL